jgi:chitin disaccharide deacetylase
VSGARVIVNADDFGMSVGITDGICLAHRYGPVTSTSMMVNMPASDYAFGRLDKFPRLGVGVHLNLCQGKPILPAEQVRTLVDDAGAFHAPAAMARKLTLWQVDRWELESEFRAQIQWLQRRLGAVLHADSHQHMHLYPAAIGPFARALAAEEIPCVRASRCSNWPRRRSVGGPHAGNAARRLMVQLYRGTLQATMFRGFESPSSRISFPHRDCNAREDMNIDWRAAFENLPAGTYEFTCHPGLSQAGFSHADRIAQQREEELRWLISPEMREAIEGNGIRLITYRELCHRQAEAASSYEVAQRRVG